MPDNGSGTKEEVCPDHRHKTKQDVWLLVPPGKCSYAWYGICAGYSLMCNNCAGGRGARGLEGADWERVAMPRAPTKLAMLSVFRSHGVPHRFIHFHLNTLGRESKRWHDQAVDAVRSPCLRTYQPRILNPRQVTRTQMACVTKMSSWRRSRCDMNEYVLIM